MVSPEAKPGRFHNPGEHRVNTMTASIIDITPLCAIWPGPWYTDPGVFVNAMWVATCLCCFLSGAAYGAWKRNP